MIGNEGQEPEDQTRVRCPLVHSVDLFFFTEETKTVLEILKIYEMEIFVVFLHRKGMENEVNSTCFTHSVLTFSSWSF